MPEDQKGGQSLQTLGLIIEIKDNDERASVEIEDEGCKTPTSQDHKIPPIRTCPPAPQKQRVVSLKNKRKFPALQFFEIIGRAEIESFFGSEFEIPSLTSRHNHKKQYTGFSYLCEDSKGYRVYQNFLIVEGLI
ncbi:hypothetical protein RJ641_033159 [Dillenia turbinata]|uniref:Uncharacterized protein n=1 Tax=Dillenia turbinata TaxID=194707 RepID=A0AAN8VLU0_9MAGN